MSAFVIVALAVVAGTAAEIVFPGRGAYHTGWYNVALIALAILTLAAVRRRFRAAATPRARAAVVALTFGTVVVAVAGVASGLLGPDNQTIVGAPGQRIRVESLGVLSFPFADSATGAVDVMLERPLRAALPIGTRPRDAGSFILRAVPRDVAYVEARDPRGGEQTQTTHCIIVFVAVNDDGEPIEVTPWVPKTEEQKRLHAYAIKLMELRKGIEEEMRAFQPAE